MDYELLFAFIGFGFLLMAIITLAIVIIQVLVRLLAWLKL